MLNPLVGSSPAIVMCVGENPPAPVVKCLFDAAKSGVVCR